MPLETLFSNPAPSVSRRTSILSRVTAPLANRNRNIAEFYVEPDDPWKVYIPGDTVTGCVVLTIVKPLPITHVVVCLHGHAKVYKNQVVPGDGLAASGFLGPGRGSRGVEYLGNGFASLFEDEVVLCGEGLLKKGIYKFKFELGFPPGGLPSSIDFERGTVSYFVTATMTRPTTIAPTLSCDRRITFQDSIDVGHVPPPKPRVISLEPISKRGRVKAKVQESSSLRLMKRIETDDSQLSNPSSADQAPLSPTASDISSTSALTSSSQSFQIVNHSPLTTGASAGNSETKSTSTSISGKVIVASTELLKGGALHGDIVPLRISINHTKPNMRGHIVVTFYRQGKIDMHPHIPVTSKSKGKRPEYEDVYPKSRTGLGGLHFSNSSPSSIFRKDLCQTTTMMIVNPHTLTADVRASIKVPDDAFPTMANVPGGMIEFKYYVEVVIDLCGKLGESRLLPRISLTSPPQSFTNTNGTDSGLQVTSNWADNILDTTQIRRGKNIVVCLFEVTVGSMDSTRASKKWNGVPQTENQPSSNIHETAPPLLEEYHGEHGYYDEHGDYDNWPEWQGWPETQMPVPGFIPPPEPEEEVDEKTRLRRQEALLLPGRPPEESSPSQAADLSAPSAPFLPEEDGLYENHVTYDGGEGSYLDRMATSATSARSVDTIVPSYSNSHPSAVYGHHTDSAPDDKQELERQRLMTEASAPPTDDDEGARPSSTSIDSPSAPVVLEEDEYNAHILRHEHEAGDNLPRYRR